MPADWPGKARKLDFCNTGGGAFPTIISAQLWAPRLATLCHDESTAFHERDRSAARLSGFFPRAWTHDRAVIVAVPGNDPTLLFTNAGMVQFKDVFLGKETPRLCARRHQSALCQGRWQAQRSRKRRLHRPASHLLRDARQFLVRRLLQARGDPLAWEFVTQRLRLDPLRLWITVYRDDDEAADAWTGDIGIDPVRVTRMGEKSNFWAMGDTGPCGPCSEIFFDHGPEVPGGPPGSPDEER